ncbi:MAG TPA: hypothetical protein VL443_17155 [Cyclobacteriaceae bacterium]|jgi:hypothetical protein|nr:hypothetical protein [Cyclobacteriaceae bacterium]
MKPFIFLGFLLSIWPGYAHALTVPHTSVSLQKKDNILLHYAPQNQQTVTELEEEEYEEGRSSKEGHATMPVLEQCISIEILYKFQKTVKSSSLLVHVPFFVLYHSLIV